MQRANAGLVTATIAQIKARPCIYSAAPVGCIPQDENSVCQARVWSSMALDKRCQGPLGSSGESALSIGKKRSGHGILLGHQLIHCPYPGIAFLMHARHVRLHGPQVKLQKNGVQDLSSRRRKPLWTGRPRKLTLVQRVGYALQVMGSSSIDSSSRPP